MGATLAMLLATPAYAKANSFAQKDGADHLLAFLTEAEDLKEAPRQGAFGMPNTGLVYSVQREPSGQMRMRFEGQGERTYHIPLSLPAGPRDKVSAWPLYVQLHAQTAEGGHIFLLGVVRTGRQAYSGGGATDSWLHLFRVENPGSDQGRAREVLVLPLAGDKVIRACFNARDETARRGACHDGYKYEAFLRLDERNRTAWPVLIYQSKASASLGPLARPGTMPDRPLTREKLAEKEDLTCTFRRTLRFNPMSRRYEMESPGPDCTDYFLPGPDSSVGLCRKSAVSALVGQSRINDRAATEFTGAGIVRQIRPGDAVTEDSRRERVTIETDPASGKIVRAWCG
ncbi:MAG: I78 family peptidase inhibitor [Sphingobium sp.]